MYRQIASSERSAVCLTRVRKQQGGLWRRMLAINSSKPIAHRLGAFTCEWSNDRRLNKAFFQDNKRMWRGRRCYYLKMVKRESHNRRLQHLLFTPRSGHGADGRGKSVACFEIWPRKTASNLCWRFRATPYATARTN
jgi:hypothetical protein